MLLLAFAMAATPAWTCSCIGSATACSVIGGSSVIFVAEVTVDSGEGWGKGLAKVKIVEPLQNVPEGLQEATIGTMAGTSCYHRLQAGVRYVIITDGPAYSVGSCNPTFRLDGNEHILDAMRSRLRGDPSRLVGAVLKSSGRYSNEDGIPAATVELRRGDVRRTATTDGAGRYWIAGLEPGRYRIQVAREGYVANDEYNHRWSGRMARNPATNRIEPVKETPGEIEIPADACEIRDLAMWPAGRIRGTVRGMDGKPLEGVTIQVFGFTDRGRRESSPLRTAVTGAGGTYQAQPLPSGQYVVGVNASMYSDEDPYPPTLHGGGQSVYLSEAGSVEGIDLTLPAPRMPVQLRVSVLTTDGKPHKGARVRLDTPAGVQRWFSRGETDENGEVVAPVYAGERYKVTAFHYLTRNNMVIKLEGAATVDVTGREPAVVRVVLQAER